MDQILHLISCAFVTSFVRGERVRIHALQTIGAVFRTIETMASAIRRLFQRSYAVIIGTCVAGLGYNELQHGGHCQDMDSLHALRREPLRLDLVSKLKKT